MDLDEHKKLFEEVVKKYNLFEKEKAEEIAKYLTKLKINKFDIEEFANLFAMKKEDAQIFLSFIDKGLKFKEDHLDKK
ncbi:MAG: hypothetical protein PF569_07450 [Candidatus Woesearchaeota archaeon]|jgi:hypothetical protein|nr:hypothetical protein [Candidatus Woesearchaeota archaeon]